MSGTCWTRAPSLCPLGFSLHSPLHSTRTLAWGVSPLSKWGMSRPSVSSHTHTDACAWVCLSVCVCVCNYRNLMERGLYLQYSSLYLNMYYYTPIIHTLCSLRGWNINPSKVWHPIISCVIQRSQAWSISTVSISCEMDEWQSNLSWNLYWQL